MGKEALVLLKSKKVSPELYFAWALHRQKYLAFLAGLFFTVLTAGIFLMIAFKVRAEYGMSGFYFVLGIGGFFTLSFLILSFTLKSGSVRSTRVGPEDFLGLGVLRMTGVSYMKKITESQWRSIREFKIPMAVAVKTFPTLDRVKSRFKAIGKWGVLLGLILLLVFSQIDAFAPSEILRSVLIGLFMILYLGAVVGFLGELFVHCLKGYLAKDLVAWGELENFRYTGPIAVFFSLLGMGIALGLFFAFLLPIYFIWYSS